MFRQIYLEQRRASAQTELVGELLNCSGLIISMKGAEVQTETRDSRENVEFGFISRGLAKRKKEEGYQHLLIPFWFSRTSVIFCAGFKKVRLLKSAVSNHKVE